MRVNTIETGCRIKLLREMSGCTQEQFAEKMNISRVYVSKLELGERSGSIDLLVEIADFFHVSLDYLILGQKNSNVQVKRSIQEAIKILSQADFQLQ